MPSCCTSNPDLRAFFERHGFSIRPVSVDDLLAEFDRQMTAGLANQGGSLAMIPSYIATDRPVPVNTPVLVMDAGGTNLRVAVVWFDEKGHARIEDFQKHPMPGTDGRELAPEEFFDTLGGYLAPLAERAPGLGFCFSYPAEILPNRDGRLIRWTKQVRAPGVVGLCVGDGMVRAVQTKTGAAPRVCVLNDTVATLLAGRSAGLSRRYSAYIGVILGTGTNTAYVERQDRIAKVPGLAPDGFMAINVESGNFDGVPQSDFDKAMDATLPDTGHGTFEKMIAGAYLGDVGLHVFKAAARDGLFSAGASAGIIAMPSLANKDFDDFVANPFTAGTPFDAIPLTDDDRRLVMALGIPVFLRAAYLVAANIAAAVLRTGEGHDPLHPVCVTVDGSTYYKTRSAQFKSHAEACLREFLGPRGIHFDVISVDDAPMVGSAVAGLTSC